MCVELAAIQIAAVTLQVYASTRVTGRTVGPWDLGTVESLRLPLPPSSTIPRTVTDCSCNLRTETRAAVLSTTPRQFFFKCSSTSQPALSGTVDTMACIVKLVLTHNQSWCNRASASSKISGGTIFLIVLLVSSFVYIVVGCIYNHRKGAAGMEKCPNFGFWRDVPGLVKDGFAYTWAKLRGCCRKSEYETL